MARAEGIRITAQPDAADREAAITSSLRDRRFLQQVERCAASPDEDEARRDALACVLEGVLDRHPPAAAVLAYKVDHVAVVVNGEARLRGQLRDEEMGQRAVIDIR